MQSQMLFSKAMLGLLILVETLFIPLTGGQTGQSFASQSSFPAFPSYISTEQEWQQWTDTAIEWAEKLEGNNAYFGMCLAFVSDAFINASTKQGHTNPGPAGWGNPNDAISDLGDKFYAGDKNPPRGALVFFSALDPYYEYGHIGICLGNNRIIHACGIVRNDPIFDSEGELSSALKNLGVIDAYLGWAFPPEQWYGSAPSSVPSGTGTVAARTPTCFYYPTGSKPAGPLENGSFGSTDDDGGYPVPDVWHCGYDIEGTEGDKVFAIADGEVVLISENGWSSNENPENYAYLICHNLLNGQKFVAVYGHLRRPWTLNVGDHVNAGNEIGCLGPLQAGRMGGSHLHFGIYQDRNEPDSCNYPSIFGRQVLPRPDAEFVDGVLAYGNWFDPISFIEERMPSNPIGGTGSAFAVVVDRSGSMEGDKMSDAATAADSFFTRLDESNQACFVTFSDSAAVEVNIGQCYPNLIDTLKYAAVSVSAGGSTNIGDGLNLAYYELVNACESDRAALLMSDGMHNAGELWPYVDLFVQSGWPVHTVAFGSDADQQTLAQIAQMTGGSFFPAGLSTITQVYNKIYSQMNNQSVLISYNDLIKQDKQLTYDVQIDQDISLATFFTDWQGSRIDLHLMLPGYEAPSQNSGGNPFREQDDPPEEMPDTQPANIITPDNFSEFDGVRYVEAPTYCFYEVEDPLPGNWLATLIGTSIDQSSEQVNLTVSGSSPLMLNIMGFQPTYNLNQPIQVVVRVSGILDGNPVELQNIELTAVIKKPRPELLRQEGDTWILDPFGQLFWELDKKDDVTLYDDGQHDDWEAGDGIYGGEYNEVDINGQYVITVTCSAELPDGTEITRVARESVQIGPIEDNKVTLRDFLGL